ncbi:MAG: DUF692 domain-containing protein [Candidatus Melainabacteria bacterium]|nr:DUF692 domain-containing protein [Candidatus Melainabacteria bacterium]
MLSQKLKKLPYLGVGLGLRRELYNPILTHKKEIDWLEIAPENYICRGGEILQRIINTKKYFSIIPHGLNLSIGGTEPFDPVLINNVKEFFKLINPPWFSDHLCFNYVEKTYIHDLIPLPFNKATVKHVAGRIKKIEDIFQIPFLIENPSYYMVLDNEINEAEFISKIVEKADCGLLLDINNVYVNSQNHKYNPVGFLDSLPLERTVQVHIAGHLNKGKIIIDTHGESIINQVYELFKELLKRCSPKAILLERDFNFPKFSELLYEIKKIRTIMKSIKKAA